jgi:hypothetical protein
MAIFREDSDRHLRRIVADEINWQEMLERLVELRKQASTSSSFLSEDGQTSVSQSFTSFGNDLDTPG